MNNARIAIILAGMSQKSANTAECRKQIRNAAEFTEKVKKKWNNPKSDMWDEDQGLM